MPARSGRVIQKHNVVSFFTAPTAFRAIRKEDPTGVLPEGHSDAISTDTVSRR